MLLTPSVSRNSLTQLLPVAPRCYPWQLGRTDMSRQHSRLLFGQSGGAIVSSQCVMRQGDPLWPLLFVITLLSPLKRVTQLHLPWLPASADDTFLRGAPALAIEAFGTLLHLAAPLGLQIPLGKCSVNPTDAHAAASVAKTHNIAHAQDGFIATGTAVGGAPAFDAAKASSCNDSACALVDALAILPLGEQDHWLVLHGSLQQRVAHIPRGGAWEPVGGAVHKTESHALDSDFSSRDDARKDGPITEQLTLPLPHGDMGRRTCASEGRAAYLAAAPRAQIALQYGPAAFHPFSGLSGDVLHPLWTLLCNEAQRL
jgi:hypothetical protein